MSHQDNCQFNLCHLYFRFINFSKYSVYTRHSINVSRSAALSAILCEMLLKESEHCQGNRQFSGCLSLVFLVQGLQSSVASRGKKVSFSCGAGVYKSEFTSATLG